MAIGPIERSLAGETDLKRIAGMKAQILVNAVAALSPAQRARFTYDGLTVTITRAPDVLRDRTGQIVGLEVWAIARDVNGPLPFSDQHHQVINPPVKIPDGGTQTIVDSEGNSVVVPTYTESLVFALRRWLVDSIRFAARQEGWQG